MKNRFNLNESEKNRIRELHLTESKDNRIISIINEVSQDLYEGMDATNIDFESQDLEKVIKTEDESDWLKEDWDDLDEEIQKSFKEHKEFKGLDDAAIREKYNSMPITALCKISRFLVGWIVNIFRGNYRTKFSKWLIGIMVVQKLGHVENDIENGNDYIRTRKK